MIEAFSDKIICVRIGDDRITSKGVRRASSGKEKPLTVRVVSSGVDKVSEGDMLLIARYSGMEFEYEDVDYLAIHDDDIIAKIKEEK